MQLKISLLVYEPMLHLIISITLLQVLLLGVRGAGVSECLCAGVCARERGVGDALTPCARRLGRHAPARPPRRPRRPRRAPAAARPRLCRSVLACARAFTAVAPPLLTPLTDRRLCCSGVRRQPRRQAALRRSSQQLQQAGTASAQR